MRRGGASRDEQLENEGALDKGKMHEREDKQVPGDDHTNSAPAARRSRYRSASQSRSRDHREREARVAQEADRTNRGSTAADSDALAASSRPVDAKASAAPSAAQGEDGGGPSANEARLARPTVERKAVVKCAAVHDDEELGGFFDPKAAEHKLRRAVSADIEPEVVQGAQKAMQERQEPLNVEDKAFAWMDSDDEDQDEGKGEGKVAEESDREGERRIDKGDADAEAEKEDDEAPVVSVACLDEVQSFGRMVILASAVRKWLQSGTVGSIEAMATCRALARTKFFDGDLLEDLHTVLRRQLQADSLDVTQVDDAIQCFRTLNAYDRGFFSAVARAFKAKTRDIGVGMRNAWLEIFRGFGHNAESDFLQLLEVPPLPATNPGYRKVRCWHFSKGSCVLEAMCSFSHDPRAPLSLADSGNEDWWRSKPLVMTHNQKTLGYGVYGISKTTDLRAPPIAPAGWLMATPVPGLPGPSLASPGLSNPSLSSPGLAGQCSNNLIAGRQSLGGLTMGPSLGI